MLWPRGRGIYPQMLPAVIRAGTARVAQAEHDGAVVSQFHAFRSDSSCGPFLDAPGIAERGELYLS